MSESQSCVFCDCRNFEERLIAEDNLFWLIATLGQITDGVYTLLIPKRHVSCMAALEADEAARAVDWLKCLWPLIQKEYGTMPTLFEHGIIGQTIPHAHLHILPAEIRFYHRVTQDYPYPDGIYEDLCESVLGLEQLCRLYQQEPRPYLFWTATRYDPPVVCWDPPAVPQCLRIMAAELLNRPERANWRNMDPELDKKLWTETVTRLKRHFAHI